MVGSYTLLWGNLITADDVLFELGYFPGRKDRVSGKAIEMDLFRASLKEGRESNVLDFLEFSRNCVCTDPRDKVFATLGLIQDKGFGMVPDYHLGVAEVFQEVVLKYIRWYRRLDILGATWLNAYEGNAELPYWLDVGRDPEIPSHRY